MAELHNELETLATRWIIGGGNPPPIPAGWRTSLDELSALDQELAALALYGQARQFNTRPRLPDGSLPGQPLPPLPLPTLPEPLRPQFRRLIKMPAANDMIWALLRMAEHRGWMAHPYDFMPTQFASRLPRTYATLRLWSADTPVIAETVQVDNWHEFAPAQRRALLANQWQQDPVSTRATLLTQFPGEPAEQRVALLDMLSNHLSPEDVEFLRSLSADRSERVRANALVMLARLGETAPLVGSQLDELRDDFEIARTGLLRRTTTVAMAVKKNNAQRNARRERLQACAWNQLCDLFGMDSAMLIAAFRFEARTDEALFVECALRTASEADIRLLSQRLLLEQRNHCLPIDLDSLLQRLDDTERMRLAIEGLARGSCLDGFGEILTLAGSPLAGDVSADAFQASPHWSHVDQLLGEFLRPDGPTELPALAKELWAIACLAPTQTARTLIARLEHRGLSSSSPVLEPLRFNAHLPENT